MKGTKTTSRKKYTPFTRFNFFTPLTFFYVIDSVMHTNILIRKYIYKKT